MEEILISIIHYLHEPLWSFISSSSDYIPLIKHMMLIIGDMKMDICGRKDWNSVQMFMIEELVLFTAMDISCLPEDNVVKMGDFG